MYTLVWIITSTCKWVWFIKSWTKYITIPMIGWITPKQKASKVVLPSRKHRRNHTYKRRVKGEIVLKIEKRLFLYFKKKTHTLYTQVCGCFSVFSSQHSQWTHFVREVEEDVVHSLLLLQHLEVTVQRTVWIHTEQKQTSSAFCKLLTYTMMWKSSSYVLIFTCHSYRLSLTSSTE